MALNNNSTLHLDINIDTDSYKLDTTVNIGGISLIANTLHLKKEIYKPGYIEIEFIVSNAQDLKDYAEKIKKHFFPGTSTTDAAGVTSKDLFTISLQQSTNILAQDYVVRDIKLRRVMRYQLQPTGTSQANRKQLVSVIIAVVKAYSPDYFLTLDKSCEVYRGQKLSQIIEAKTKDNPIFWRYASTGDGKNTVPNGGRSIFPPYEERRLCHTTRTYNSSYPLEMLQPYLVQYNESFYDFAIRVANRCGELFYYENGELVLGLHKDYVAHVDTTAKVTKLSDRDGITYSVYPFRVETTEKDGQKTTHTADVKSMQTIEDMEGDITLYDEGDITINDNVSKNLLTNDNMASASAPCRDENVGMDEALREIDRDKDSISKSTLNDSHWFEVAHEAFKADGLATFISKSGAKAAEIPMLSALIIDGNLGDDVKITIKEKEETAANKYSTPKAENNKQNLSNEFYSWMESQEQKVEAGIQESHREALSSNDVLLLGACVTVKGLSSNESGDPYYVYGVDLTIDTLLTEGDTEDTPTYTVDLNVKYCPLLSDNSRATGLPYQEKVFPPLAGIPHIRKSEPQQASVQRIDDPLRNGRVQIFYPWQTRTLIDQDKDTYEETSPWINVSTPFTGKADSGLLMTPDKYDYVMVNYEGGNIERPYVDGSLFHAERGATNWGDNPIFAPRQDFRKSHYAITKNGNGITFVDGMTRNFIGGLFPSFIQPILNAKDTLKDEHRLGGGMVLSDYYGIYSIAMSSAGRSIDINSPWGTVNINAFTGITLSAPNGDIKISGKNVTIEAGNKVSITSGKNIKGRKVDIGTELGKVLASAAGSVAGSALKSTLQTTCGLDPTKLLDLSFLRSCYEIIFRPVDGSLTMTSKRNLIMQAGQGKATTPSSTLSDVSMPKKSFGLDAKSIIKNALKSMVNLAPENERDVPVSAHSMLGALIYTDCAIIDQVYADLKANISTINSAIEPIRDLFNESATVHISDGDWNTLDKFLGKALGDDEWADDIPDTFFAQGGDENEKNDKYDLLKEIFGKIRTKKQTITGSLNVFGKADNLFDNKLYFSKQKENVYGFGEEKNARSTLTPDNPSQRIILIKLYGGNEPGDNSSKIAKLIETYATLDKQIEESKSCYKRYVLYDVTYNSTNTVWAGGNKPPVNVASLLQPAEGNDANWKAYINAIKGITPKSQGPKSNSTASALAGSFLSSAGLDDYASYDEDAEEWTFLGGLQKTFNINGKAGPRSMWDGSQSHGEILMSSNRATYMLPSSSAENTGLKKVGKVKELPELNDIL